MKNGFNMYLRTLVTFNSLNNLRSFNILFFMLFFFSGCFDSYQVDPLIFKKMVSARNLGIAYLEEERYSDAVNEFEKLTQIAPEEPSGYANIGLAYMRMNNRLKESEIYLQKAFNLSPENPDIRLLLAEFYQLSGNDERL